MKKTLTILFILLMGCNLADAQILKDAKKLLNTKTGGLTEKDASDGIREALVNGTDSSVRIVSAVNGFWGNPEIKIPFPPDAREMESKLRAIGMGKKVDEFNESMNRAAEKAATEAKPIFVNAIKSMTVKDAISIVRGPENSATIYLKKTTSKDLTEKFQPVIKTALDNVDATRYWKDLITTYNKIPLVRKMNPDLPQYVTQKALDGLFVMISKEELRIRKDPAARTSELLKKVFGK